MTRHEGMHIEVTVSWPSFTTGWSTEGVNVGQTFENYCTELERTLADVFPEANVQVSETSDLLASDRVRVYDAGDDEEAVRLTIDDVRRDVWSAGAFYAFLPAADPS